jgi:aromatase
VSGHTDNSVFIDAGIDLVWQVTNDVPNWPRLFTEYAAAEILARDGNTVRFRLTMHPDENGTVWSWVSERTLHRDTWSVVARRVEPGPFEYMNIEWTYRPEGVGTRMRWVQEFAMRADAPLDDAAMVHRIDANSRIQMNLIRDKVERLATERAPVGGGSPGAGRRLSA